LIYARVKTPLPRAPLCNQPLAKLTARTNKETTENSTKRGIATAEELFVGTNIRSVTFKRNASENYPLYPQTPPRGFMAFMSMGAYRQQEIQYDMD